MRRAFGAGILALFLSAPAAAAEPREVTISGGFQAVAHREIATGPSTQAMVYSVLGALNLDMGPDAPRALSAECLGFDEHGGGSTTIGLGRCAWKDADGDTIFVTIATRGDRNVYTVTGGTGKWSKAEGDIRTTFTYLPAPAGMFLLSEVGSGRLTAPTSKHVKE